MRARIIVIACLAAAPAAADCRGRDIGHGRLFIDCGDGRHGVFRDGRGQLTGPFQPFDQALSARLRPTPRGFAVEEDAPLPRRRPPAPLESWPLR